MSEEVSSFQPQFVEPLQNVTVAEGREATFTCVVDHLGGYRGVGNGRVVEVEEEEGGGGRGGGGVGRKEEEEEEEENEENKEWVE
ncbi:hypothetical protein Pcinc_030860 [Petrolisthes cinctipes]|uniref:Uncharacterized protein n=1 Tax=Petrolisthes cinctipes TaxID=88211 RepID=A0AAE1K5E7_PETCI|nr:hypothetical protein Pcinc_030860 [Petrolisthes cinctipes]